MIVIIVALFVLCLSSIGGYYWYVQNNETIDLEDPVADVTTDNDPEEETDPVYEVAAAAEVEEEPFVDETAVIVEQENENDPDVTKPLCVGAWENVGVCTKGCGGGKQNQQWKVTTPGENCAVPEGQRQRQLDCNSQGCTVGDLLVEKGWRTAQQVLRMSTSDQRNTMIVELKNATDTPVTTLQGKNNAALIAMAKSL